MREIYEDLKLNAKYKNRNQAAIQRSLEKIQAVQTIRNVVALQRMGVSTDQVRQMMQSDKGLLAAPFAKTNKEIGMGSDPDSDDGGLNMLDIVKKLNAQQEQPTSQP